MRRPLKPQVVARQVNDLLRRRRHRHDRLGDDHDLGGPRISTCAAA